MLTIVYGNLYKIEKKRLCIGTLSNMRATVVLSDEDLSQSATKSKQTLPEETKGDADYHVARLDQENVPMTAVTAHNLRLLPSDASLDNIESRMTSVSLGKS